MDTALKQRLIGAVVLVAVAVIFLPMLIKGPAPDSGVSDVPLETPAAPNGQYETRELPLVTPGNAPSGGVVGLENATPANAASAAPAASSEAVPLGAAPAAAEMLPASTAGGNFAVNFGAYATIADADAVIARLKQSKLPGYREPATIGGKPAYRVRIGPYADRADAETVRLQAAQVRSDVTAQVVTLDAPTAATASASASTPQPAAVVAPVTAQALPPEPVKPAQTSPTATAPAKPVVAAPKPAPPPAKPAEAPKPAAANVGFAVQLGAFSKPEDADALRDRLRAGGFSAFVEQVRTDKGTLSRVRVGPVISRADADQLKAQIASKVGMDGMVRPHP